MSPRDTCFSQQDADHSNTGTLSAAVRDALTLIIAELTAQTHENPEFRDALTTVDDWLSQQDNSASQTTNSHDETPAPISFQNSNAPAPTDSGRPRHSDVSDNDLALIAERCRLKAEGARWAVERDELLRDGADFSFDIRPGWLRHGGQWCRLSWFPAQPRENGLFVTSHALCGEDSNRSYRLDFDLSGEELTLIWDEQLANGPLRRCPGM